MSAVTKRLKQLDREVADATAEVKKAEQAYVAERDSRQEIKLEKIWH